jgi:hypothetical protein
MRNPFLFFHSKTDKITYSNISMKFDHILSALGGIFNQKNLDSFNTAMSDFGKSMDLITKEFSDDVTKSNESRKKRESKDKENLEKIWGKKE